MKPRNFTVTAAMTSAAALLKSLADLKTVDAAVSRLQPRPPQPSAKLFAAPPVAAERQAR